MTSPGTYARKGKYLSGGPISEHLQISSMLIVGIGLAFQVGHFVEHTVQFAVWVSGASQWVVSNFCGRNIPYMSAPVTKAVSAAGAYLFPTADVGRQVTRGMEKLHLLGNTVFLAT